MPETNNLYQHEEGSEENDNKLKETTMVHQYNKTIIKKHEAIRFLLNLPDYAPIPKDAKKQIKKLVADWEENQKQTKFILEKQLQNLLQLEQNQTIIPSVVPSIQEVRHQVDIEVPYKDKLSDLVLEMRET